MRQSRKFFWNKNDAFGALVKNEAGDILVEDGSKRHIFNIAADFVDKSSGSADFTCSTIDESQSSEIKSLFALYPAEGAFTTDDEATYTYGIAQEQSQSGADTDHLSGKLLMYAHTANYNAISFKHLTGVIQFCITNGAETGRAIRSVKVTTGESGNTVFSTAGAITASPSDYAAAPAISRSGEVKEMTLAFSNASVDAGAKLEGYLLMMPGASLKDQTLIFTVKDDKGEYSSTLDADRIVEFNNCENFETGKTYKFNMSLKEALTINNASISDWEVGTEEDLELTN